MLLTAKTILYVTGNDGTSEMSLLAFSNAIKGGLKLEEVREEVLNLTNVCNMYIYVQKY